MKTFPKIVLIYNRYKKASLTKQASVEVRITYNYRQKYISTGVMLYKNQWKDSEVVNTDQAQVINLYLSKLLADIRRVIIKMQDNGCINLDEIQAELNRLKNSDITFIDYCKKRAEIRKYGKSEDTKQRYDRFIRLFMSWGHIKTFNDITESNIIDYDKYLASNGMKAYSKWNNYHRCNQ